MCTKKVRVGCIAAITAVCMMVLQGCGGGSSNPAAAQATFSGTIVDSTGKPVALANVILPADAVNGFAYNTQTAADGTYSFVASASDFTGVPQVVMIVDGLGFAPQLYTYSNITAGKSYVVSAPNNSLTPLLPGEFVPNNGWQLYHLGDNNFAQPDGQILQNFLTGSSVTLGLPGLSSQFSTINISGMFRGVQSQSVPCNDTIELIQKNPLTLQVSVDLTQFLVDSPSETLAPASYTFPVAPFDVTQPVSIKFTSNDCGGGNLDDFEFTSLMVTYK